MYKYIFLALLVFFTGCSNRTYTLDGKIIKENNIKEESISFKEYKNISKDMVLNAAKKVFILSGKDQFRLDSYRNSLLVSKTKMKYYPLIVLVEDDYWELKVEEKDNVSKATLNISRVLNNDFENIQYIEKDAHELFWIRLDYLLGISKTWERCSTFWETNGILCDSVDLTTSNIPKKEDILDKSNISNINKKIYLNENDSDILKEDIELTLEENKEDILENKQEKNEKLDKNFDRVIEELDKKVNENIDATLDKIKEDINDEVIDSK